jgi:phosphatidylinositol glycan class A protein
MYYYTEIRLILIIFESLQVISTKVGGIPEVLPCSMITLSEPNVADLIKKLDKLIGKFKCGKLIDKIEMHEKIKNMYNWHDVAKRTEIVYNSVANNHLPRDLKSKLKR